MIPIWPSPERRATHAVAQVAVLLASTVNGRPPASALAAAWARLTSGVASPAKSASGVVVSTPALLKLPT